METQVQVYLTLEDAAALIGVSRVTLWRWVKSGEITPNAYQSGKSETPLFDRGHLLMEVSAREYKQSQKKKKPDTSEIAS